VSKNFSFYFGVFVFEVSQRIHFVFFLALRLLFHLAKGETAAENHH